MKKIVLKLKMDARNHSNGASLKSQTSRGKMVLLSIMVAISISGFAQNNDCDFSQETITHINQGFEDDSLCNTMSSRYSQIKYKRDAINSLYKARQNNPRCETILHQISNWLVECGLLEQDVKYYAHAIEKFENSINVSNEILRVTTDVNIRQETLLLISQANTYLVRVQELRKAQQIAEEEEAAALKAKKEAEKDLKNTSTFIVLGTGLGMSYAMGGANFSIYMHPNGLLLTGAIGYGGGWNIGGGYSLGVYKYNGHVKFLYGKNSKTTVGYMGVGGNFDIIGDHIGLNADIGVGGDLDLTQPSFLGSVGIYVKF